MYMKEQKWMLWGVAIVIIMTALVILTGILTQ
jgi:hypothetical protein